VCCCDRDEQYVGAVNDNSTANMKRFAASADTSDYDLMMPAGYNEEGRYAEDFRYDVLPR